jgi:DNA (cytosine-5)-methyltransferase 1
MVCYSAFTESLYVLSNYSQGFSGINRYQKTNDIKNSLVACFLSYIDHYRPKYLLLENVRGLVSHKLGGQQVGANRQQGGIKMGTVKFILRALTSLGYQAQVSILQAGQLGAPQSRRRVIFWGVAPGFKMPLYPQPSHLFNSKTASTTISLSTGVKIDTIIRRGAPHAMTTVADAISDLPAFEYRNPRIIIPASPSTIAEEAERSAVVTSYEVPKQRKGDIVTNWVGKDLQTYPHPPLSEYQRRAREGVGNDQLTCHITRPWGDSMVERICSIPMAAGADHRQLPRKLKPWCLSDPKSAAVRNNYFPGLYGRLGWNDAFQTALTQVHPNGKQGVSLVMKSLTTSLTANIFEESASSHSASGDIRTRA